VNDLAAEIVWTAVDPIPSLGISNDTAVGGGLVEGVDTYVSPELCDDQGNCATGSVEVKVDVTAPVLVLNAPVSGTSVLAGDYVAPSCSATDALSGVDGECSVSVSEPVESPGSAVFTATATASDVAGNTATMSSTYTVVYDADAPSITATADTNPNAEGWWNTPVSFSFECVDTQSGVLSCPGPVTFADDGANQSVTVTAIDNSGNEGSFVVSGVNVDRTAPVVSINVDRPVWNYTEIIDVTCVATDALSGVASTDCPEAGVTAAELGVGETDLFVRALDTAGNEATDSVTVTVVVDADDILTVAAGFVADQGNKSNGLLKPLANHLDGGTPQWVRAYADVDRSKLLIAGEKAVLHDLIEAYARSRGSAVTC